jgi:3-hydroxyacyl-CoA dehydrogenase/enoyl-CoA hydratase/3-hydroxybutyryl-CoA epimerase/3-hydroxyacyl-CoA dehydrogenase/enoyl-CoA hydratase/3-hydroxybutyryl-CoA epimerase/enoyl-CoA isomerase
MNEALQLLHEGASMDEIDKAAEKFGMPLGPIALQDQVGLDVAAFAGKVLAKAYPDRAKPSPLVLELVKAGRLGKKTGAGFRSFAGKGGKASIDPAFAPILEKHRTGETREFSREELTDRLFLPMLLEATRVLEEGIVREASDVDMGLILGIGFPPFRGGILRWCDIEGAAKILERLERYKPLGRRFEPTEILVHQAKTGAKFYPIPKIGG